MGYDWFCSGRESWLVKSQGKLWLCCRESDKCSPGRIQDSLQNRCEPGRGINDGQKSSNSGQGDGQNVRRGEEGWATPPQALWLKTGASSDPCVSLPNHYCGSQDRSVLSYPCPAGLALTIGLLLLSIDFGPQAVLLAETSPYTAILILGSPRVGMPSLTASAMRLRANSTTPPSLFFP